MTIQFMAAAVRFLLRHNVRRHTFSLLLVHQCEYQAGRYLPHAAIPIAQFRSSSRDSGAEKDGVYLEGEGFASKVTDLGKVDGAGEALLAATGGDGDGLLLAPVRALISVLDGYHDATGLPWWIVIATSTLALRISLMPVLILQLKKMGKLSQLFTKLPPPFPPPFSGISFREQFSLHRKKRRELGCPSYLWTFASFTVQFPFFLLWLTTIRRMSLGGHPGFDNGGALWFQNLSDLPHGVCGPFFPVLIAGLHFTNVQVSFKNFTAAKLPGLLGLLAKYYKLYLDMLSLPLLAIGFCIPQGSLVYWVTNSSLTLIQGMFYCLIIVFRWFSVDHQVKNQLVLRSRYAHKRLGLPQFDAKTESKISGADIGPKMESHVSTYILSNGGNVLTKQQLSGEIENHDPVELLQLGLQNLTTGNHDRALALLWLVTKKDPDSVRALIAIGQILCSRGSLAESAEYFEHAISKLPEDDQSFLLLALFGAGVSRINEGKKLEGIEHLKRLSSLKEPEAPMDKACYYQGIAFLGSTLFNDCQNSEAVEYLRRAATYDSKFHEFVKECEKELEENKHTDV